MTLSDLIINSLFFTASLEPMYWYPTDSFYNSRLFNALVLYGVYLVVGSFGIMSSYAMKPFSVPRLLTYVGIVVALLALSFPFIFAFLVIGTLYGFPMLVVPWVFSGLFIWISDWYRKKSQAPL